MKWFNTKSDSDSEGTQPTRSSRTPANDMHTELGIQPERRGAARTRAVRSNDHARTASVPLQAEVYDEEVRLNDLKVRARRRLIGAAVLLAVAFVVLPWVFDSGRKQTASSVNVVVADKNLQFDVKNPRAETKSNTQSGSNLPPAPNDLLYPAQAQTQVTPPQKTAPDVPNKANPAKLDKTVGGANSTGSDSTTPSASPKTVPTVPPVTKPATTSTQKYAVHIGLVSDSKELDALLSKLRAVGVEPQLKTVVVDGVSKTRVRLGLFDSQEQAVAAANKSKGAAKNPVVIPIKSEASTNK